MRRIDSGKKVPPGRSIRKTKRARRDLAEIAAHLGEDSVEIELKFLRCAELAFEALAAMPGMGARREYAHPGLADLRMWPVPEFPRILIFYRPQEDGVEIVRILHASRDQEGLMAQPGGDIDTYSNHLSMTSWRHGVMFSEEILWPA